MIRRPPRSTLSSSSAASDVYKRQLQYTNWISMLSIVGFVDTYGGWVLIGVLVATLAYRGLATIPFLSPLFGDDSEDSANTTNNKSSSSGRSPTCLLYTSPSPRDS
eukprot:TRINITY_DN60821_c0_g1_i1.p1 TRINITY_DN60821_c0_g1~~TRINITY_DN60821_c0_g1_i1.p1  ORF type:complete len:106 (+),score=17.93 TRINITY_DN60821_c0_g1_i1:104-421(+)